jgi:membrane-bound metal-dependent hydrolase YbcI (DUF457 family)
MFPTHIKCSTFAGIAGGAVAHIGYGVPLTTSMVGAGLCAVGGILPDIDSGPGIPLREITTFLASVVPTMLITRLLSYNFTQESLILTGGAIYIGIRFGLSHFLREYTVHRGMFHSFPSMAIFGELTYLAFYGESTFVRLFMVSAVSLGFFIHLLLDEIYSVQWDGKPRLKKSFGTAMKFVGSGWWPNFTCYAKLAVLTYIVMNDPSVIQQLYTGQGQEVAKNLGQTLKDQYNSTMANARAKASGDGGVLALIPHGLTTRSTASPPALATSSTGRAPMFPWPAAPTAPTSTQLPAGPQLASPQTTANWSVPADPANSPGTSTRPERVLNPDVPASRNTAQPANNRFFSPSSGQQTSGVPFWQ